MHDTTIQKKKKSKIRRYSLSLPILFLILPILSSGGRCRPVVFNLCCTYIMWCTLSQASLPAALRRGRLICGETHLNCLSNASCLTCHLAVYLKQLVLNLLLCCLKQLSAVLRLLPVEKRSSHHSASQKKSQLNQRRGRLASSGFQFRPWWRLCCTAPGCPRGSGPGRVRPRSPAGRSRCRPWSRRRPRGGGAAGGPA